MALKPGDVRDLFRALESGQWDDMSLRVGEARIRVKRRSPSGARPVAASLGAPVAGEPARARSASVWAQTADEEPGVHRVSASRVGRLVWAGEHSALVGMRVGRDTLLARIEAGDTSADIVAGMSGELIHVSAFDNQAFVEYGQLLALIQPDHAPD